jgi:hypothetical protein
MCKIIEAISNHAIPFGKHAVGKEGASTQNITAICTLQTPILNNNI